MRVDEAEVVVLPEAEVDEPELVVELCDDDDEELDEVDGVVGGGPGGDGPGLLVDEGFAAGGGVVAWRLCKA